MVPDALLPLAANDQLFHLLAETAMDGIVVIDAQGVVQIYNHACEKLFGYREREVIGRNVKMLLPETDTGEHDRLLAQCHSTNDGRFAGAGRKAIGERKDHSIFFMYLSVGQTILDGKKIYIAVIRDLTEINDEAVHRLDSDRLLAQIVQSSNDAIISKTPEGLVTSWNAGAERIFGYAAAEMIGKDIAVLIPADHRVDENQISSRVRAGEIVEHYETMRLGKDGGEVYVSLSVAPIRDNAGRIIGATKIARDISEKRRDAILKQQMQNEFAHVARLSAMSETSAAIAHELNQPLTAIISYVQATLRLLKPHDPAAAQIEKARETMQKVANQAKRAASIIRYLREFAEKRDSRKRMEDLNDVLREAVTLAFVGRADSHVKISMDLAPDIPPVKIDKIQIQQVLLNLIRNSMEAMATVKHPRITLSSGREESDPDSAFVIIRDIGPGLSAEVAEKLFKPFVTTKDEGMGIGLSICQSIMVAHGGDIRVLNDGAPGAGFCFHLPLAQSAHDAL